MQPIIVLDERVSKLEQREAAPALPPNVVAPTGMPLAVSFVGRVDELEDVKRRLREGNNAVGVFAVEGIAGVGKTALAALIVCAALERPPSLAARSGWVARDGPATRAWRKSGPMSPRQLGAQSLATEPDPDVAVRSWPPSWPNASARSSRSITLSLQWAASQG